MMSIFVLVKSFLSPGIPHPESLTAASPFHTKHIGYGVAVRATSGAARRACDMPARPGRARSPGPGEAPRYSHVGLSLLRAHEVDREVGIRVVRVEGYGAVEMPAGLVADRETDEAIPARRGESVDIHRLARRDRG